jgi:hypothetical protein
MQVITTRAMGFWSKSTPGGVAFVEHRAGPQYLPDDVLDTPAFQGALATKIVSLWPPVNSDKIETQAIVEPSETIIAAKLSESVPAKSTQNSESSVIVNRAKQVMRRGAR